MQGLCLCIRQVQVPAYGEQNPVIRVPLNGAGKRFARVAKDKAAAIAARLRQEAEHARSDETRELLAGEVQHVARQVTSWWPRPILAALVKIYTRLHDDHESWCLRRDRWAAASAILRMAAVRQMYKEENGNNWDPFSWYYVCERIPDDIRHSVTKSEMAQAISELVEMVKI